MKPLKRILLAVIATALLHPAQAQPVDYTMRTDVNPALIYWREFMIREQIYADDPHFELIDKYDADHQLTPKIVNLLEAYDRSFRDLDRATKMKAPVDWGQDSTEGPNLMLPHLSLGKFYARVARARIHLYLANHNEDEALKDIKSTLFLARNIANDPYLISILVQFAMERIVLETIAENLDLFSDDTLHQLEEILTELPPPGIVADSIPIEKRCIAGWLEHHIQKIADEDLPVVAEWAKIESLVRETFSYAGNTADRILTSTSSAERLLNATRESYRYYDELEALMRLPIRKAVHEVDLFFNGINAETNPVVSPLFPPLSGSILKEAGAKIRFAQTQAAIQYRLAGLEAANSIQDPMGDGPFQIRETNKNGNKGFVVTSVFEDVQYKELFVPTYNQ